MSEIFISYAREDQRRVEGLARALESRGWAVWWDPELRTGEDFGIAIENALRTARLVLVVWSRESVGSGWVRDEARVGLERGVLVPVRIDAIDPPLGFRQLQVADLTGFDATAPGPAFEKLARDIERFREGRPGDRGGTDGLATGAAGGPGAGRSAGRGWPRALLAGAALAAAAALAYSLVPEVHRPPEAAVVVPPRAPEPAVARPTPDDRGAEEAALCSAKWKSRQEALAADPRNEALLQAQADCGMRLLQNARRSGESSFAEFVAPIREVLVRAVESASGTRAADLHAHIGWSGFLERRDREPGTAGVDRTFYQIATREDPDNPYANAMWGHAILWQRGSLAEAQARFARALASGREREFVRRLQIAASLLHPGEPSAFEALRVANEMRGNGEAPPTSEPDRRVWSSFWGLYYDQLLAASSEAFLQALPADDHLATFRWLLPEAETPEDKRGLWALFAARLEENAGQRSAAHAHYVWLRAELARQGAEGPLRERAEEGIRRLSERP